MRIRNDSKYIDFELDDVAAVKWNKLEETLYWDKATGFQFYKRYTVGLNNVGVFHLSQEDIQH